MNRPDHRPGQHRLLRWWLPLVATLAALVSAPAVPAKAAAGAAAEETARLMEAVGPTEVGPGALVNTLGLRATTMDLAGRYVTIADGRPRLQTRVANQLFTEFGVFRDAGGRFRLLGADGRWVKLLWVRERKRYEAGTWATRWAGAWSFKLKRPTTFGAGVVHELADMGIDSRQAVCVLAYTPLGSPRGLLAVSRSGVTLLRTAARCGESTSSLFITDSLRKGVDPAALTKGVKIDPITYVRFVPPDRPALTLSVDNRRLMRNEVIAYFDMLADYNDWLRNDILWAVDTAANALLGTTYTIPGDKARDVNLAAFFVDQASYVLNIIPVYGAAASGALKATYDTVELGVSLAHNRNLEGPRAVESVTSKVLARSTEIHNEYDAAYSHFGRNLESLRGSILKGCTDPATCTSDRKLSAWLRADPMKNVTSEVQRLTRDSEVARHELVIWRKLLPVRGVLFAHEYLTFMPGRAADTNCDPGYPLNSPYRNEEILEAYDFWTALRPPRALAATGVYYPYYNRYKCFWGTTVHRAYFEGWNLGLVNNDGTVTPLDDALQNRLFNPWDPARPKAAEGTGFGLSRVDVACRWLGNRAHGYMGSNGYYFNPCHFAFHDVNGAVVSPYQWEDSHYAAAAPYSVAYWIPDPAEVAAGRKTTDPDVLSPLVPRLEFGSCAAYHAGATKTVPGGTAVKAYFTNLHDGAIDVYRIRANGSKVLLFSLPRQDQLARPLPNTSKGPLPLTYSRPINTTAGTSFLVRRHGDNACIGTWTAGKLPAGAPVDYAVAEVHGNDGILSDY